MNITGRLALGNSIISPQNQHRLRVSLEKNTTLDQIVLRRCRLTDAIVDDLITLIETNSTLSHLQLPEAQFTDAGLSKVLNSLCQNTTLINLDLWRSPLTDAVVPDLCRFLEGNKVMRTLQFFQAQFTDVGVSQLLQSLCQNSLLLHLNIPQSQLTNLIIGDLCKFLEVNKVMTDLQFHKAEFSDSGFSRILQCLCEDLTSDTLVIWQSKLTDAVVPDVCRFLKVNKVMSTLQFHQAQFTDAGFSRILQSLCNNATLKTLSIWQSKLTDAVVTDICHFLEVNKVMSCIRFLQAEFTDDGFSQIMSSLSENSTLDGLSFKDAEFTDAGFSSILRSLCNNSVLEYIDIDKSQLTDAVVPDVCQFLEVNKVMIGLIFARATFTDDGFARILQSLCVNNTLNILAVKDPIDDGCVLPLVEFVELRKDLIEISSVSREETACLEITSSNHSHRSYYYIITVDGQVRILRRSECLQTKLKDFLAEHAVPSAIDIMKNELILFVQKDEEHQFLQELNEQMKSINIDFVSTCKVEPLESPFEFVFQDNDEKCCPGSCVCFTDSSDKEFHTTVGVFLKDDKDKLYFLSTFHGNEFKKCHINNIVCKCVAEVHQTSPLLDACLMEVPEPEGKLKCSPVLPHIESALCGPYTGPTEDLAVQYVQGSSPGTGAKRTIVRKYGAYTHLTTGVLLYSNFILPEKGITDALLIRPSSGWDSFTEGGDSGAAIFKNFPYPSMHTDMALCYEGLAFTCGEVGVKEQKGPVATRLDDVIKHFEKELDRRLYLLGTDKCGLREQLSKLEL